MTEKEKIKYQWKIYIVKLLCGLGHVCLPSMSRMTKPCRHSERVGLNWVHQLVYTWRLSPYCIQQVCAHLPSQDFDTRTKIGTTVHFFRETHTHVKLTSNISSCLVADRFLTFHDVVRISDICSIFIDFGKFVHESSKDVDQLQTLNRRHLMTTISPHYRNAIGPRLNSCYDVVFSHTLQEY